jgi:hypothetical protein
MRAVTGVVTLGLFMTACAAGAGDEAGPVKVEVVQTGSGWQLLRDGEPYVVRGAGMGIDDIERFASTGGNSIRNWTTEADYQDTRALLDAAQRHGVTVALGLPMKAERHGFDYDDEVAVREQFDYMREQVLEYKDHPALLVWLIGNELNHSYGNPKVYDAVNDVARMIRDIDPYHPTSTTVAGFHPEVNATIAERAPALDFVSFQLYGSLFDLRKRLEASRFEEPFMVTEWGAIGYWEVEETAWGAPVEMTSSKKAETFLRGYREVLAKIDHQLLGSYVFLWGQKQERTPSWFGMFTESGNATEVVDVMQYIWTGAWPANRTPRVDALTLDGRGATDSVTLRTRDVVAVQLAVTDAEGGPLKFRLAVKRESDSTKEGGDYEEPIPDQDGWLADPSSATTKLTALAAGRYRLFAWAKDDGGRVAHANLPFRVISGQGRE